MALDNLKAFSPTSPPSSVEIYFSINDLIAAIKQVDARLALIEAKVAVIEKREMGKRK